MMLFITSLLNLLHSKIGFPLSQDLKLDKVSLSKLNYKIDAILISLISQYTIVSNWIYINK